MPILNRTCLYCGKKFHAKQSNIDAGGGKYCSIKCTGEGKKRGGFYPCCKCGKLIWRRPSDIKKATTGLVYCSHSCAVSGSNSLCKSGENHPNWINGNGSYNERAKRHYGKKCVNGESCPLKDIKLPSFMYDVDHIDRNRKNNKMENLQVMCVWCHREKHKNGV